MPSAAATSRASNYSASNMYPDSYVAPRHRDVDRLASAGNPAGSRGNTYTKPDQPRSQLYARSLFRPGMIVRAALHGKLCLSSILYHLAFSSALEQVEAASALKLAPQLKFLNLRPMLTPILQNVRTL